MSYAVHGCCDLALQLIVKIEGLYYYDDKNGDVRGTLIKYCPWCAKRLVPDVCEG
jgi:hypothetical protein